MHIKCNIIPSFIKSVLLIIVRFIIIKKKHYLLSTSFHLNVDLTKSSINHIEGWTQQFQ